MSDFSQHDNMTKLSGGNDMYKKTWKEREQIVREKTIEQKLVKAVGQLGGICPKLTCPGFDGMPDRLVLMPGGRMAFVEVKAPGRGLRPLQAARQRLLTQLGYKIRGTADFYGGLEKMGFIRRRTNSGRKIAGLKLKTGQDFLA